MGQWVKNRLLSNLKGGDKQKEKGVICLPASFSLSVIVFKKALSGFPH